MKRVNFSQQITCSNRFNKSLIRLNSVEREIWKAWRLLRFTWTLIQFRQFPDEQRIDSNFQRLICLSRIISSHMKIDMNQKILIRINQAKNMVRGVKWIVSGQVWGSFCLGINTKKTYEPESPSVASSMLKRRLTNFFFPDTYKWFL